MRNLSYRLMYLVLLAAFGCTAAQAQTYTSTTTLAISPGTVARGADATATATVTSSSGQTATGTVTFSAAGNVLATVALTNGVAVLSSSTSTLAAAVYPVKAVYNGNSQTSKSTSAVVNFTVKGVTTTAFTVAPPVVATGAAATLQVAISTNGGTPASGTVQFYSGSTLLVQATVTGGAVSLKVPSKGYAEGTYSLTARYLGDAKNEPSSGTATVVLESTTPAFTITPAGAALATGGSASFSVTPTAGSTVTWYVNGVAGGSAATGAIDSSGNYTAPSAASPASVLISAAEASAPKLYSAAVPVYVVVPGSVSGSHNPQVATYSIQAPAGGQMSVEFGLDTSYGLNTWQQPTPSDGSAQTMLVAGMMAPDTYHMRADIDFGNGIVYQDPDRTFLTALVFSPPSAAAVTQGAGMAPQPGIELVNTPSDHLYGYDLNGDFIWGLTFPAGASLTSFYQPVKQMPNGHLLVQISPSNAYPVGGGSVEGAVIAIQEMLLDGTVVRQLTIDQLNAALAASGYVDGQGNLPTLYAMHHDVTINPVTGHWLVLSNTLRTEPETNGPASVLGDVVLDVDPSNNFKVGWVWNSFDHLDVTRHPDSVQEWTHTNTLLYSPTDHQLLLSMRYQNWILKVDYNDGKGTGAIIWHFGYQGDFTLVNGTSPQDWVYGQHEPSFTTTNTDGVFGLTMMDNGLSRLFAAGYDCVNGTAKPCEYSRAPQFTVDETNMTATLGTVMPYQNYSYFGGNAEILANGDAHADFCSVVDTDTLEHGVIEEYTGGDDPQFVWSLDLGGSVQAYRSHRWGSFYPGVTWTNVQSAEKAGRRN